MEKLTSTKKVTVKVWEQTHIKLKLMHAITGKSMMQIMNELVEAKFEEFQNSEANSLPTSQQ